MHRSLNKAFEIFIADYKIYLGQRYVSTLCSLQIEEHCPWVFDGSFDCLQCCNCFPSINETMIVCQSDIHHWPYNNLKIFIRHKFMIIIFETFQVKLFSYITVHSDICLPVRFELQAAQMSHAFQVLRIGVDL